MQQFYEADLLRAITATFPPLLHCKETVLAESVFPQIIILTASTVLSFHWELEEKHLKSADLTSAQTLHLHARFPRQFHLRICDIEILPLAFGIVLISLSVRKIF